MGRERPLGSEPYQQHPTCHQPSGEWMRSVPLDIRSHKRGEVVRTRTTILQAHTQQWMGTFGNPGNGDYRGDLLRAADVITGYITSQHLPLHRAILRLDGQYGDYAVVIDLDKLGLAYVMGGKDYGLLDQPEIQARLALSPDQVVTHPETGTTRALARLSGCRLNPDGASHTSHRGYSSCGGDPCSHWHHARWGSV
jgi:hypothetical protein